MSRTSQLAWDVDELSCEDFLVKARIAAAPNGRVSVAWASPQGVSHHFYEGSWQSEKITSEPASHVEIAYDVQSRLHAVYDANGEPSDGHFRYREKGRLVHALRDANSWTTEVVANDLWHNSPTFNEDSHYPRLSRLALDAAGHPVVAFFDLRSIHVARREETGWTVHEVTRGLGHQDFALALHPDGGIHLFCRKPHGYEQMSVHLWSKTCNEWQSEFPISQVGQGRHAEDKELVVAPDGSLHAVFEDSVGSMDRALYIHKRDGSWSDPTMVEKKGHNGYGNALCIDRAGVMHLVYRIHKSRRCASSIAAVPALIRYAVCTEGSWRVEEVGEGGWDCAMSIAHDGQPWIVYPKEFKYRPKDPSVLLAVARPRKVG